MRRVFLASVVLAAAAGCAAKAPAPAAAPAAAPVAAPPVVESGFLSDYSRLRASEQSAAVRFWRDEAGKGAFRRLLVRPVSVWRDAGVAGDVPEEDLQSIADLFYEALEKELGRSFELAREPGPGVLEIDIGFTLVANPDGDIDSYRTTVPVEGLEARTGPLAEPTRRFLGDCLLEVEFRVTLPPPAKVPGVPSMPAKERKKVRAAFLDARRGAESPKGSVRTWEDVEAVFAKWSEALDERLTALRDGTFQPRLTLKDDAAAKPRP